MRTKVASTPVMRPRVTLPAFQPTPALEVACRAGSNQDITRAFESATQHWDQQATFFRVGPNPYTVSGIIREMKTHSHYGNEFLTQLRRQYG